VQITYDRSAGALVDIRVGDAHLAETLLGLPLCEGDVLLNDRGFTRRAGIVAVANQRAYQLGRWSQTGARLQKEDGTTLGVDEWLEGIEAEHCIAERPGRCVFDAQIVPVRVLALRLPPEQARQAQQRLQRIAVRKMRQIRASTFKRAGWVILVSTLPTEYSASELFWLYRSRWQIERLIALDETTASPGPVAERTAGVDPYHSAGLGVGLELARRSRPGHRAAIAENEWHSRRAARGISPPGAAVGS
jgi:hypothetical protein